MYVFLRTGDLIKATRARERRKLTAISARIIPYSEVGAGKGCITGDGPSWGVTVCEAMAMGALVVTMTLLTAMLPILPGPLRKFTRKT